MAGAGKDPQGLPAHPWSELGQPEQVGQGCIQLGFECLQGWSSPSLWAACSSVIPALARLFAGLDPAFPWLSGTGEPRLGVGDETSQKHPLCKGFWVSQEQKLRECGLKHLRERVLWNRWPSFTGRKFPGGEGCPKAGWVYFWSPGCVGRSWVPFRPDHWQDRKTIPRPGLFIFFL